MRNLYGHKFLLPKGTQVFVPSDEGRKLGSIIAAKVAKRWNAPSHYYHMQRGGHVAASRVHANHAHIASLDLARFFNQVTRTKVHRSLCAIGVQHKDAFEIACNSTVEEVPGSGQFTLPFGFVQSPVLASLSLAKSALGRALKSSRSQTLTVSVYVDDLTISSNNLEELSHTIASLHLAAGLSKFEFNVDKSQGPSPQIQCFNILFGNGLMAITDDRVSAFVAQISVGSSEQIDGILSYVKTVNELQYETLAAVA